MKSYKTEIATCKFDRMLDLHMVWDAPKYRFSAWAIDMDGN